MSLKCLQMSQSRHFPPIGYTNLKFLTPSLHWADEVWCWGNWICIEQNNPSNLIQESNLLKLSSHLPTTSSLKCKMCSKNWRRSKEIWELGFDSWMNLTSWIMSAYCVAYPWYEWVNEWCWIHEMLHEMIFLWTFRGHFISTT